MTLSNDVDLLNPLVEVEKRKYKLKRLVQSPNSNFFFMDVKCQGCIFKQEMHSEEEDGTVRGVWRNVIPNDGYTDILGNNEDQVLEAAAF
ncbi:40S ribosomal protein S27-2 [Tanacetum coccineum]